MLNVMSSKIIDYIDTIKCICHENVFVKKDVIQICKILGYIVICWDGYGSSDSSIIICFLMFGILYMNLVFFLNQKSDFQD